MTFSPAELKHEIGIAVPIPRNLAKSVTVE